MTIHFPRALLSPASILMCCALMAAQHRASAPSIPSDTPITVRINERLSSETSHAGDSFTGTLAQPLVVNGRTLFPKGGAVTGTIISVKKSGRLSDPGVLELELVSIAKTKVSSQPFLIKGVSHTKSNVTKIGGGTAAGAIIGAILGGGKGAAIGAGVGAGAGTATAAATGKKPATVESEAVLEFRAGNPAQSPAAVRSAQVLRSREPEYNDGPARSVNYVNRQRPRYDRDGEDENDDRDDQGRDSGPSDLYSFSERDHQVLRSCLASYDFESLPPGIQKKLARGGSLPPGQAKRLRLLPGSCTAQLPLLPPDEERIIFGDRVILLSGSSRILDIIVLAR